MDKSPRKGSRKEPLKLFEPEGRYDRLKLIRWWDQSKLRNARVLVVGAGAIGNEVLKNLALSGIGHLYIIDMDRIDLSNLSRTVLFRDRDEGKKKSVVAARAVEAVNPDVRATAFDGDVRTDLGLGLFRRMDVVIGAVDNIDARIFVNGACWTFGIPYVDGGTLGLSGQVRIVRPPDGSCYECTLSKGDYERLQERVHCNLLTSADIAQGRFPTTSIASSIVGAIQAQKAIEILHGLPVPAGKAIVYGGELVGGEHEMYMASLDPREHDWHSHSSMETWKDVVRLPLTSEKATAGRILDRARKDLGAGAILELRQNFVDAFDCRPCGTSRKAAKPLVKCRREDALCPRCRTVGEPRLVYKVEAGDAHARRRLSELGIPALDVVSVRNGLRTAHYELSGDEAEVLGMQRRRRRGHPHH